MINGFLGPSGIEKSLQSANLLLRWICSICTVQWPHEANEGLKCDQCEQETELVLTEFKLTEIKLNLIII